MRKLLVLFFLLAVTSSDVYAQTFRILTEEFPPYNYTQDSQVIGISTEIVREMLKRIDHPDNLTVMPWSKGYNLAQKEDNVILFSTTRTPMREKLFKWVGPLVPNNTVFFAKKASGISIASMEDARKVKSIGVYKDDFGELLLKEKGFTNLDSVVDNKKNVKKLLNGTIDLWIINELTGKHLAGEVGFGGKIEKIFDLQKEYMYLAFSKTTPDAVINRWQTVLDEIKADGAYAKIYKRWLASSGMEELKPGKRIVVSTVKGSSDSVAGLAVIREAYRRIGYDVQVKMLPGKKALEYSNGGKVDAELQRIDGITRKFKNLVQVPIPINYVQASVFTKDVTFPVRDWYSLKPYKIGIVKGIIFAKEGTRGMDVLETDSYEELVDRLEAGDIDIAVMPRISVLAEIKRQKSKNIKELEGVLETLFLYHYVHKKQADLVPKLEKELKRMLLDGTTRRLRTEAYERLLGGS